MISAPVWLGELIKAFHSKGHTAYVVGGAVRDELLDKTVQEWDIATDMTPDETEKLLHDIRAKSIGTVGKRFGTITAQFHGETVEITTFRTEQYEVSSRKPETKFGNDLKDDLSRRDFTINAIAYDPIKLELIDPFGGQDDLKKKIVRAVGSPNQRFGEDPLRMLRAIRFAAQLDFEIEPETMQAIIDEREHFGILSAERISQEIDKILLSPRPSLGITLLVESRLIEYILPELLPSINLEFEAHEHKDIYHHILQVLDQTPPKLPLRWCALLHDIAKPLTRQKIDGEFHFLGHENLGGKMARTILTRLKYPNDFIKYLVHIVRQHQRIPGYDGAWSDGGVRRFVRDAGEALDDLFTFAEADQSGKNEKKLALYRSRRAELKERIDKLEKEAEIAKIKSPLDGAELMEIFKRPAGPWIKPIKEHLLALVLDGKLGEKDKKEATDIARMLIKNLSSQ
ncbi:MAG: HD domain-containing protein [Candidatus Berkelbacteria bacterium]|nr:MAG: HD domain-containing protein [Candidatus Berkelbacteria bacterium]QQG51405.1 MAG: HD domain-containing protein [Candidatus Berkelbacteria bacterium]